MKGVFCFIAVLLVHLSYSALPRYKSAGCSVLSPSESGQTGGTSANYTVDIDGLTRTYIVHLPTNYKPRLAKDYPVIFALPGFLTSAQEFHDEMNINGHSDDNNYIIVYPQGNELIRGNGEIIYNWNDLSSSRSPTPSGPTCDTANLNRAIAVAQAICPDSDGGSCAWTNCQVDDVGFIDQLVDLIEDEFCIDTSKEYVIGFSNGGMMTQRLACSRNDRFAAAVPMHGQLHIGDNCKPQSGSRKMPIMNIWGSNDQILPGKDIVSRTGWWFLPVTAVQDEFSTHNGCDKSGGQQSYPTASDDELPGNRTWECTGFVDGCQDYPVIACEHTWGHDYPINKNTNENWAIETIWEFLDQFENRYLDP